MAAALERSFIEICGFEREPAHRFREVTVNLGVSPLSNGIKFPDGAGAFHYEESGKLLAVTTNRFIHWSTSGDKVQLVEESLDSNLINNAVRIRFRDCSVLPGGVQIQETLSNVVVLICTTQSVHRITLPHPTRMYRSELVTEQHAQSVFTDVGKLSLQDPSYSALIPGGHTGTPTTCAAWLSFQGEAHFALASPARGITVVTMPPQDVGGAVTTLELKRSSMMRRISGWMPTAIRGDQNPADTVLGLAVRQLEENSFIFALCQDHKLRMWSLAEQVCLLEADMLDYMPAGRGVGRLPGQGHRLRLAFSASTGLCLGVYLAVPQKGQFTVLQLVATDNNRYSLEHISSLFSTQETLVDFALTSSDVWALWLDDSNTTVVRHINFEQNTSGQWNQVYVQPSPLEEVPIGADLDPRETYLDVLFSPLHFTSSAIVKALQIFRRGSDSTFDPSWESLKKEVTLAVESEVQSSVVEFEYSQEEYRQLQMEFWSRFYSCCLQYQEVQSCPLGLTVNQHTGMVCLLRKGFISFVLPCFAVDHLYLSHEPYLMAEEATSITDDPEAGRDIVQLVQCLRLVSDSISTEMESEMEKSLQYLQIPERAADLVLENMLCNDNDNVIVDIQNKLQDIRNPMAAMTVLLRELDLETDTEFGDSSVTSGFPLNVRVNLSQLYSSSTAVSMVCQALCHLSLTRAVLCRDLLILQKLYLRFGDVFLGGGTQLLQLQQDLIPRTSILLSTYHLLKQISQSLTSSIAVDTIEMNLQHLNALELSDTPAVCSSSVLNPQTVVELFYQTSARKMIVSQIFSRQQSDALLLWSHMVPNLVHLLAQLLWPSNPGFHFPEVLMANCQYAQLQEYVRLIGPWSQVNIGSCRFLLGQCYLANGEGQKALQCFQEAATEVEKEEFLMKLTSGGGEDRGSTPRLQFYTKVLHLLEDVGLPELVIQLASLAVTEASEDINYQSFLWTRIFKHHLDLGHNSEAYEALTQNPEINMQLDCLRQLVVVLCERSQLQDLVQFPYVNLHDEVVNIIETRARSVDLLTHNYYDLLYAFHIARNNYRKAGTVMYEFGMRLGREVRTQLGLQKQVNCYLAALNCLRLIRPKYAWIVQPTCGTVYERPGASPKRNSEGDFPSEPAARKRQVDILELNDLEKEYFLSRARLTLARQHPPSAAIAGSASAPELVSLLVQTGLFDTALALSQTYKLNLNPVFEGLTFKCINLQLGGEESQNEAWSWLAANQLSVTNTKESSAADEAWRLLGSYLDKYPSTNRQHHHQVISKLLSHGVSPPDWLVQSYKRVDAASLLRLFLNFDLLEPAAELVLEYVDAVLGRGHQYFGIERPLSATSPPAWLPYTSIDQLLRGLSETQTHSSLHSKVQDKLDEYHNIVRHVTKLRLTAQQRVAVL